MGYSANVEHKAAIITPKRPQPEGLVAPLHPQNITRHQEPPVRIHQILHHPSVIHASDDRARLRRLLPRPRQHQDQEGLLRSQLGLRQLGKLDRRAFLRARAQGRRGLQLDQGGDIREHPDRGREAVQLRVRRLSLIHI